MCSIKLFNSWIWGVLYHGLQITPYKLPVILHWEGDYALKMFFFENLVVKSLKKEGKHWISGAQKNITYNIKCGPQDHPNSKEIDDHTTNRMMRETNTNFMWSGTFLAFLCGEQFSQPNSPSAASKIVCPVATSSSHTAARVSRKLPKVAHVRVCTSASCVLRQQKTLFHGWAFMDWI